MNTPEEVACQIVPSRLRPGCVRISDTGGDAWVTLRDEDDISALRKLFERVVEKASREGAAAALAGQQHSDPTAHVRPFLEKPLTVEVGQVWRAVATEVEGPPRPSRDMEVVRVENGIAKLVANGDVWCQTQFMLELEAWRFVGHGRDLAGRIRSLVNRYTDIWLALGTWDPEGEAAVAECLAILRGILRVERGVLGVDSTQALLERARGDAASMPDSLRGKMLTRLVVEIETVVRECEAQR